MRKGGVLCMRKGPKNARGRKLYIRTEREDLPVRVQGKGYDNRYATTDVFGNYLSSQ